LTQFMLKLHSSCWIHRLVAKDNNSTTWNTICSRPEDHDMNHILHYMMGSSALESRSSSSQQLI
jgi:hypothetical protein